MDRYKLLSLFLLSILVSNCSSEITYEEKNKLVNGFIDFYNSLPNQVNTCDEGYLQNAQQTETLNCFKIEATLKVSDRHNLDSTKYLKCTGTVVDLGDVGVSVLNHHCEETSPDNKEIEEVVVTESSRDAEAPFVTPVQLDNEVQTNTAVTSGEQFIAVPREEAKVHCIGCSSHVDPNARGVTELASIAVRQLDSIEPNTQHTLNRVVDVERQVQVVNGIRYILTLLVDYNSCLTPETETCLNTKTCKINILEKPWVQLPDGSKYRAILSNNCTEEWRFGDDGVVIPQTPTDHKISPSPSSGSDSDDFIKPVHNIEVQSQQHTEKKLSDVDIKDIEQQIIPHNRFEKHDSESTFVAASEPTVESEPSKEHAVKVESVSQFSGNSIPLNNAVKVESLSDDKKKAIDDMLSFFNFAGLDAVPLDEDKTRTKRSYNEDLNVMNLVGKFQKLKTKVENAKYVYELAQIVVDYLNEMDLEIKNRVLKDVVNAEEEFENHQHFYYVQFHIAIQCDTANCEEKDTKSKICNAVLDASEQHVKILTVFCNDEPKKIPLGKVKKVPFNDPVLLKLVTEAVTIIKVESNSSKAMELTKIIDANTQKVSGTLTTFSLVLDYLNCNKSMPHYSRSNCSIIEELGSQICDVTIYERHWLKEKKITYLCNERPVDISFASERKIGVKKNASDHAIDDMVQEALQYLELKSNRNNKQIVVRVNSVKTQLVAGLLTDIEFIVGYTTCSNDVKIDTTKCKLLENEPIRTCKAQIWDRTWIEDGRQVDVSCSEPNSEHNELSNAEDTTQGSFQINNVNLPEYEELAEESLQRYLQKSSGNRHYELIDVQSATVEYVTGTITKLKFKISPTDCQIDSTGKVSSFKCKVLDSSDLSICDSTIWKKPWTDIKEINTTCQIVEKYSRVKRSTVVGFVGGENEKDPNKPEYKKLAEESLGQYLRNLGNDDPYLVDSVDKVSTQIVAGKLTQIDFKASPVAPKTGDGIACKSRIWEQQWRNFKEINITCVINHSQTRQKRYISKDSTNGNLGGVQVQDPTKDEYKKIAQDSLMKYLKREKNSEPHSVVDVKKVSKKIVAGIIYTLEFIAAPESCASNILNCENESVVLNCNARVWDRMGRKKINIQCDSNKRERKPCSLGVDIDELQDDFEMDMMELDTDKEGTREKRQINDEDYIDEDMRNYYADRVIRHINDNSGSSNLYKLITIHAAQNSMHMGTPMVRMYIETAETFCLRHRDEDILPECEELDGMAHQLCLARLWPSSDDERIVNQVAVVCDDDEKFETVTGLSISKLITAALRELEKAPNSQYKLVHQGEPQVIPSLDSNYPTTINFVTASTNCSKHLQLNTENQLDNDCFIDLSRPSKACQAYVWLEPNSRNIKKITAQCSRNVSRKKRSLNTSNSTADDLIIQNMVRESLDKLEMASQHRYKQRLLKINSYSTKVTSGKVTTIDFDVGYTSCLKYEWVDDEKTCEFLEHLPRRHCVSQVWERLWLSNGRNIEVTCEEDETPLEAHVEFESADTAMKLANEALKHIEAKYPHPRKQKIVRIFSLEKQVVAGIHYRMKVEVGPTQCSALSAETDCKLDKNIGTNKFCRVNVWMRPWTDHPPNYRISCDYQEGAAADIYHHIQAEQLFSDFLTTYKPEYINDHSEMRNRFEIFKTNIRKIHELNTHERGTATYGVTRFADLSYEEFGRKYLGLKQSLRNTNLVPMRQAEIPSVQDIPDKFDWRDHDAVTEVKNQGSCGSCWAFSVTGNIEGQWKMQSGTLVSLSEQELVDCDTLDQGCNGGLPDNAYRAIEQLGGLELENDYPYEGEDDKCSFNKTMSRVRISGAVNITSNETDMAKWLVQNGPISIGINANAMQFYMGGVSHPWKMLCNPSNLDHGVLIVGYGIKDYPLFHKKLPYWTIKNSWGPDWGERGYYRVFRGDGTCGVNMMASSAVI